MSEEKKACIFCTHCKRRSGSTMHQCRYYPPKQNGFPLVRANDWCRCFSLDKEALADLEEKKAKRKAKFDEVRKALERKG